MYLLRMYRLIFSNALILVCWLVVVPPQYGLVLPQRASSWEGLHDLSCTSCTPQLEDRVVCAIQPALAPCCFRKVVNSIPSILLRLTTRPTGLCTQKRAPFCHLPQQRGRIAPFSSFRIGLGVALIVCQIPACLLCSYWPNLAFFTICCKAVLPLWASGRKEQDTDVINKSIE